MLCHCSGCNLLEVHHDTAQTCIYVRTASFMNSCKADLVWGSSSNRCVAASHPFAGDTARLASTWPILLSGVQCDFCWVPYTFDPFQSAVQTSEATTPVPAVCASATWKFRQSSNLLPLVHRYSTLPCCRTVHDAQARHGASTPIVMHSQPLSLEASASKQVLMFLPPLPPSTSRCLQMAPPEAVSTHRSCMRCRRPC